MAKLIEITGKALSGEWGTDDETGAGIPVLRTTNFTNEGVVNYEDVVTRTIAKDNIDEKYLRSGDIIIEKSGGSDKQPVGRVIYFDGPEKTYLFNNFTGLLRVKNQEEWFPKYVFYSLFGNYKRGGTKAFENKTTGLHNLKTDDYVSRYEIAEIDYIEQISVCDKLDRLHRIIKMREDEIKKLDDLIKARFVEMFGDPIYNKKGWDISTVEDVCLEIYGGGTPSKAHPEYYEDGDIPWVSSKDMKSDVLYGSQIYINQLGVDNSTARMVPANSVIMVIRSGILKHTLPIAINAVPITVNQDLKAFVPGNRILSRFLAVQFKMHESDILTGVRAVTADNIEFNSLKKRQIIVPPIDLQKTFIDFCTQVDKSKVAVQNALNETQILFDSLMQEYFG
jgi:type I restriction enzyme S subunit